MWSEFMTHAIGRNKLASFPFFCHASLTAAQAFMAALRGCENFINIDVSSLFSTGFLDQVQRH
jgi:hypothetical protein